MTDFSKLKKAPTGASFTYGPIAVPKDQLAQSEQFFVDPDPPRIDPLDVKHDGVTLRELLRCDESNRREFRIAASFGSIPVRASITPAQRAAISAHWSVELRAKVAASAERERNAVRVDLQDEP